MAYFDRRDFALAIPERSAPGLYRKVFKRALDVFVVLMLAAPVAVVVAILAVCVAMDGKSPFYLQKRVGKNGREFSMIKLRSMVPDAKAKLEDYLASNEAARQEWDHHQKLKNDPRITKVGHVIRKTSLDELPQLWNVFVGEMSLVGPRPMMTCQRKLYPGQAYYSMRPGITGLWQVSDRNETSFAQRAFYDNQYYSELSLSSDLSLLMRTVSVVVKASGH